MTQAAFITPLPPESVRPDRSPPPSLREAIAYATESAGSGLRRKLSLSAAEACRLDGESARSLARALEAFHDASLVFDDLPCMDDAEERRGRACLHRVAGESQAILAALALVNEAYTDIWSVAARHPERCLRLSRAVRRAIGDRGILLGQARDLAFDPSLGAREVAAIAGLKTGMLLALALLLPALLAGASFGELLRLRRIARDWGIAYQGLDDFGDLLLTADETGKTPYRDLRRNRPNIVLSLGSGAALQSVERRLDTSERQITQLVWEEARWRFLSAFQARFRERFEAVRKAVELA